VGSVQPVQPRQLDLPNRTFGNANVGRIFSARDPRQMQAGVRLTF
jgi:hypothetical protein